MQPLNKYILESYEGMITEAFQSTKLRELAKILKQFKAENCEIKNNVNITLKFFPRGIQWDKIPDSEVHLGESGDKSFAKNYVNDDYVCIWYPVIQQMHNPRAYSNVTNIDECYMTCGDKFISMRPSRANVSFVKNRPDENIMHSLGIKDVFNDTEYGNGDNLIPINNLTYTVDNIIRGLNPSGNNSGSYVAAYKTVPYKNPYIGKSKSGRASNNLGSLTIKDLTSGKIIACVCALSKETLKNYSTLDLMAKRYESRLGMTYANDKEWLKKYAMLKNVQRKKDAEDLKNQIKAKEINIDDIKEKLSNAITSLKLMMQDDIVRALRKYIDSIANDANSTETFASMMFGGYDLCMYNKDLVNYTRLGKDDLKIANDILKEMSVYYEDVTNNNIKDLSIDRINECIKITIELINKNK